MRNHLNRFTQIVSTTLFVDNAFVDASCSNVVRLSRLYAQKSFIMSQVEVGFVSVFLIGFGLTDDAAVITVFVTALGDALNKYKQTH